MGRRFVFCFPFPISTYNVLFLSCSHTVLLVVVVLVVVVVGLVRVAGRAGMKYRDLCPNRLGDCIS